MQTMSRIAMTAAILLCWPAGHLLAQNTQDTPAAPSSSSPPASTPPAATTAPSTEPAAPAAPAAAPPATTTTEHATKKKKPAKTVSRRREIDKSIESGTVPARYRNSVPKEYQQYIPFSKE